MEFSSFSLCAEIGTLAMRCSPVMIIRLLSALGRAVMLSAALAACTGGGSSAPTPSADVTSATAPFSSNVELGAQPATVALPNAGAIAATMTFPGIANGTAVAMATATTAPAGLAPLGVSHVQASGTLTVYEYITVTPRSTITLPSLPAIKLTFPSSTLIAGKAFFYGISDPDAQGGLVQFATQGPGTIGGQIVSFAPVAQPITLLAGHRVTFVVYATSALNAATHIYVGLFSASQVYTYDSHGNRTNPTVDLSIFGLHTALQSVELDSAGNIYVGYLESFSGVSVLRANADGSNPLPGYFVIGQYRIGFAIDNLGRALVRGGWTVPTVSIYSPDGSITPLVQSGLSLFFGPIATDASGKIYTLDGNQLKCFTPLGVRSSPTITIPDLGPPPYYAATNANILAVGVDGTIYIETNSAVRTYNPDGSAGSLTIPLTTANTLGGTPAFAVDAIGQVYVVDGAFIKTYKPDGSRIMPTIPIANAASGYEVSGIAVK